VPYLSALEVCSRQGAIQIHVYLTLPYLTVVVSVACQQWTSQTNTNYANGRGNPATTIHLCQTACLSNVQCNGVDWVSFAAAGGKCWLSGPWSGARGATAGVTHYVLNRHCPGKL